MKKTLAIFKTIFQLIIVMFFVASINTKVDKKILKVENINLNKTLDLAAMTETITNLQIGDLYKSYATYTGSLTGYAADCPKCTGRLGCSPYTDVRDGTLYYEDSQFGKVRIVASSKQLPCGTILTFKSSRVPNGEIIAIVLDRGVRGRSIDLLSESEEYAKDNIGRSTISYDILRNGWENE